MATPSYVWRGPKALVRGKVEWTFELDKITVTFAYTGPFALCLAKGPRPGQVITEFNLYGLKVVRGVAKEGDADSGTYEVTLSTPENKDSGDVGFETLGDPIYELEWGELTKALETHPRCGFLKPDRPHYDSNGSPEEPDPDTGKVKGKRRTWDDWADLDEDDYDDSAGPTTWSLETYQAKRRKGVESYNVGAPVLRRTLYYFSNPTGVGADVFHPQTPPSAANPPSGYLWLLTADGMTKEGKKRTRKTEWTGATDIDDDLYPDTGF